jgi:hypothetical protein
MFYLLSVPICTPFLILCKIHPQLAPIYLIALQITSSAQCCLLVSVLTEPKTLRFSCVPVKYQAARETIWIRLRAGSCKSNLKAKNSASPWFHSIVIMTYVNLQGKGNSHQIGL